MRAMPNWNTKWINRFPVRLGLRTYQWMWCHWPMLRTAPTISDCVCNWAESMAPTASACIFRFQFGTIHQPILWYFLPRTRYKRSRCPVDRRSGNHQQLRWNGKDAKCWENNRFIAHRNVWLTLRPVLAISATADPLPAPSSSKSDRWVSARGGVCTVYIAIWPKKTRGNYDVLETREPDFGTVTLTTYQYVQSIGADNANDYCIDEAW